MKTVETDRPKRLEHTVLFREMKFLSYSEYILFPSMYPLDIQKQVKRIKFRQIRPRQEHTKGPLTGKNLLARHMQFPAQYKIPM